MSFEFAGLLFSTESKRARVIAQSWLTAGGLNDPETIHEWLDTVRPEGFAAECLDCWFALEEHDATRPDRDELISTFQELASDRRWLED